MNKILFTLCFCFCLSHLSFAQMSAGFSLGFMNYHGDLTQRYIDHKEVNISYGVFVAKRYANPKLSLKGQLQLGSISGNDANYISRANRGLKFTSSITFVGTALEYAPLARKNFNSEGEFIPQTNIFASAGFGFTFFNPKVQGLDDKAPDRIAEISKTMFTIPLSIGIRFDMSQEWTLALEGKYFMPFTDYLDGISAAASPANSDKYLFFGLSLARKWGDMKGVRMKR